MARVFSRAVTDVSQPSGDQSPPQPREASSADASAPAGGSWPPLPPSVVNRLVSSATATPFVPDERPAISQMPFSCVVDPPTKKARVRIVPAEEKPEEAPRAVVPTAPPNGPRPAVVANPALNAQTRVLLTGADATIPPMPVPMATTPPFTSATSTAPFSGTPPPFEFTLPKRPQVRWWTGSTVILLVGCLAGIVQYQRIQRAKLEVPPPPAAAPRAAEDKAGAAAASSTSVATPFTALKQAKETIKDAGEKHKAAYDLVEKMLDDPNAAVDGAPKPVIAPSVTPTPEPEVTNKPKRDAVAVLLGSDGEFVVPAGSPKPSLGFARWLKAAKIGGTRLTGQPRVLIGASAYTFGDVVELNLGVVLEGYNAETRALRFKEPSGAVIERRI